MPAITKPNQHFDATTYTGTGSALSVTNGGFQPDWVWTKTRNSASSHRLTDSVRGVTKVLYSDLADAEGTEAQGLLSFNTNGYTAGTGSSNQNGTTYVGWQWKAGGTSVINTSGTISSNVSANPTAGFSVVTYTSTTGTVGHGLGVAPSMIIMKGRNVSDQWTVGHASLNGGSSPWNYGLPLDDTAATQTNSGFWNNTAPTSTVFSQGSWDSGYTKVAYCFAPVAGYSAFGSYVGNSSSDGPFIYTGFKPRFVLLKSASDAVNWYVYDTSRDTGNLAGNQLYPNLSNAEVSSVGIDILSNGFKVRYNASPLNASGSTYIYACFAENPFKYANAR